VFVVIITVLPSAWSARRPDDQFEPEFPTPEVGRHEENFPAFSGRLPGEVASYDQETFPDST
jgi:hypothetical protein